MMFVVFDESLAEAATTSAAELHASTSAWRSALDGLDALPRTFDLGIVAACCAIALAVRVLDVLRRRRAPFAASDEQSAHRPSC